MSPEQARGEPVDARSDLFSLGVVLYEMATGRPPFTGSTSAMIFDGILHGEVQPPSRMNPNVPHELDTVILRSLEKDPARRPQSAAELRDALAGPAPGSAAFSRASFARSFRSARRPRRHLVAAISVALVAEHHRCLDSGCATKRGPDGCERIDRRAPFQRSEPGQRPGVLLRRALRGAPRRAREELTAAGHRANLVIPVQGEERRPSRDRQETWRRPSPRRQRPQGRQSSADYRSADQSV